MQQQPHGEPLTEEAILVQRAIRHDAEAFGRLYDMHVDRIYRHVYYRVGNKADAEDLTQQVFLKAWLAIGRYRKMASPFVAWLMTISHNLIIDFYRTRKPESYLDADFVARDPAQSPEGAAEASFEQQRLRKAILQLHRDEQQVVILRLIEGFGFKEIAALMGKKEGNTRVILHRALVKLRRLLEKESS
ncbi:MAG: RNA polymerase sigma factor [Chloroflexota bacterium]